MGADAGGAGIEARDFEDENLAVVLPLIRVLPAQALAFPTF